MTFAGRALLTHHPVDPVPAASRINSTWTLLGELLSNLSNVLAAAAGELTRLPPANHIHDHVGFVLVRIAVEPPLIAGDALRQLFGGEEQPD